MQASVQSIQKRAWMEGFTQVRRAWLLLSDRLDSAGKEEKDSNDPAAQPSIA